jgi:chitodextrinase/lysophospholipase L1-like esterase
MHYILQFSQKTYIQREYIIRRKHMPSLKSPKLLNRSKLFNSSIVLLTAVFLSALVMSLFPRSGAAANNISLVKEVGSANYASSTNANSLTITVPAAGVTKGDTIIIMAGNSGSSIYANKVTDTRGNAYKVDVRKSSTATSVNTTLLSATVNTALVGGDTIKITFSGSVGFLQALATDWQGIISGTGRLDAKATRQGNATSLSTNATPATVQGNELVIGSFAAATPGGFTAGTSYAPFATQLKGQVGTTYRNQWQEYRLVSSTGSYNATATSSQTTQYAGAVATYKAVDGTPPSTPTGLNSTASTVNSVTLSWTASTDDVAVAGYHLYLNGNAAGTSTSTSATFSGLSCGNTYTFGVDAYDAAGNNSPQAAFVGSTAVCDTEAPTDPSGLNVNGVSASSVSLGWSPSTDNIAVAGYGLYKNGVLVGNTTSNTAVFSSLACATTYTFGVDAYDANGNRSAQVSIDGTTDTCDIATPSVSLTAPVDGSTVTGPVAVNADASDDRGVVGVQFKLDGNNLSAEDTSAPYSVNWNTPSATNGAHTLTAVARDAAGNTTTSTPVTVTVSNVSTVAPMPLISRGKPAFASSGTASTANDSSYSSYWSPSAFPGWLAYNLSSVPAAQRTQVVVGWYNDPLTTPYDYKLINDVAYNLTRDYTIEVNPAPGGTTAPTTGWVTQATVVGNTYHSRQHLIDMTGYNWIRINITAGIGSGKPMLNMDVHDASAGANDSWIFYGDSITEDGMAHEPPSFAGGTNYSLLINSAKPAYFPAYEDAGIGGIGSPEGAANINKWLSTFPGKYVALDFGNTDVLSCGSADAYYNNYVTMVQAVLAANKVPVVPTIIWQVDSNTQSCGPAYITKVQQLYAAYPQIIKGPDFWTFFKANPSYISGDKIHPNETGYAAYRQQWANTMLNNVYNK